MTAPDLEGIEPGVDWEAEYNVRLLHPDRHVFHERCIKASRAVYREMPCTREIRYGAGQRALLDLFPASPAAAAGRVPVVAFFHGGYWHSHERHEYAFVAKAF